MEGGAHGRDEFLWLLRTRADSTPVEQHSRALQFQFDLKSRGHEIGQRLRNPELRLGEYGMIAARVFEHERMGRTDQGRARAEIACQGGGA
jgi:hypothetical protein